jgi:hypothetical protein
MTERIEILAQLDNDEFKDSRGHMDLVKIVKEVYVNSVITSRGVNRCPVSAGTMTFKEAHGGMRLTWRQFLGLMTLVAIISTGGTAIAWVTKLGGLP